MQSRPLLAILPCVALLQLCQFIADSLATCGELSQRPAEREVLR